MNPSVRLGWRLAGEGANPARLRAAMVALSSAIGTAVLLCVVAVARAETLVGPQVFRPGDMTPLLVAVVLTVAVPVLVLAATVGRLSSQLRDRRLANLRLLGLTPGQTRVVAVTEAGVAAVAGTLAGWLLFLLVRPLLAWSDLAGRSWELAWLRPTLLDYLLVLLAVPLAVAGVAALPQRLDMRAALARARRTDARPPSPWRIAPLAVGLVPCLWALLRDQPGEATNTEAMVLFGGFALMGLGVVLVLPVLVRLVADGLLRLPSGPASTIAARRLQAQPAGVSRVVSGLLIGLFVVTGARSVVVAFEDTPQYQQSARSVLEQQRILVSSDRAGLESAQQLAARALQLRGVEQALPLPRLASPCTAAGDPCLEAIVASCAELAVIAPRLSGCREGEPMWLAGGEDRFGGPVPETVSWHASDYGHGEGSPSVTTAVPTARIVGEVWTELSPADADVLLPPGTEGVAKAVETSQTTVLVLAGPGRDLIDRIDAADLGGSGYSAYGTEDYDFVAGLRALVWAVAAVVLGVGLLSFAVAAVDRALARRREVVSLQLLGVPPRVLRRAQWIEASLPIGVGSLLAVGLGLLAGATYLGLAESTLSAPYQQSLALAAVALVGAVVVAGLTVVAASPRIRPELIRAE